MKNIHLLPTNKPTKLFKDDFDNFIYSINMDQEQNLQIYAKYIE
jgi:hypothetical protein